jgi:hypothetical protein
MQQVGQLCRYMLCSLQGRVYVWVDTRYHDIGCALDLRRCVMYEFPFQKDYFESNSRSLHQGVVCCSKTFNEYWVLIEDDLWVRICTHWLIAGINSLCHCASMSLINLSQNDLGKARAFSCPVTSATLSAMENRSTYAWRIGRKWSNCTRLEYIIVYLRVMYRCQWLHGFSTIIASNLWSLPLLLSARYSSSLWGTKPRGPRKMGAVIPKVQPNGERLMCRTGSGGAEVHG